MFCWFFKLTISHVCDTGRPLWPITQKHLNKCTHCREFYNFCLSIAEELPAEADRLSHDFHTVLHQRIQHYINEISTDVTYTRIKVWSIGIAAVLTVIILLSGISLFTNHQETQVLENQNNPDIVSVTNELEKLFASGIELTKANAAIENPIMTELQNLTASTQSAASFLLACVDVDIAYTNDNEEQK